MSKIFVRERTRIGKGAGRPRFVIVAIEGLDMKVYTQHIRKLELEKLAEEVGAQIVYLPRGEKSEDSELSEKSKKNQRHRRRFED